MVEVPTSDRTRWGSRTRISQGAQTRRSPHHSLRDRRLNSTHLLAVSSISTRGIPSRASIAETFPLPENLFPANVQDHHHSRPTTAAEQGHAEAVSESPLSMADSSASRASYSSDFKPSHPMCKRRS